MDDFLSDSAAGLFGEQPVEDDGIVFYGPLKLTVAQKEGKANTLLADHLFSPSLLLAEQLERGAISLAGKHVIELGAGCALPSLLASTLSPPPALVVVTDYPDDTILNNLLRNVAENRPAVAHGCTVLAQGYEWGADAAPLLEVAPRERMDGYDAVILSDLLHFDRSHDVLLASLLALLRRAPDARAYVAAGTYTPARVCESFVRAAGAAGLVLEEQPVDEGWRGTLDVHGSGLDRKQLAVRKTMCRWWIGRWDEKEKTAEAQVSQ